MAGALEVTTIEERTAGRLKQSATVIWRMDNM